MYEQFLGQSQRLLLRVGPRGRSPNSAAVGGSQSLVSIMAPTMIKMRPETMAIWLSLILQNVDARVRTCRARALERRGFAKARPASSFGRRARVLVNASLSLSLCVCLG